MISSYLLSCFFGILSCFLTDTVAREGIIDGELVRNNHERFSYHVSIQTRTYGNWHAFCGGGIIDDKFILTAAHCVLNKDLSGGIIVIAGTIDGDNESLPAEEKVVKRVFWPKHYKYMTGAAGDIAVLELTNPLRLLHHRHWKLHLPQNEREMYENVTAEFAGIGNNQIDAYGQWTGDRKLRFAQAKVMVNCIGSQQIGEEFICAQIVPHGRSRPRSVTNGDSGSPLVYNRIVIGILSICPINPLEIPLRPAVYTRVTHYLHFIRNAMKNFIDDDIATFEFM